MRPLGRQSSVEINNTMVSKIDVKKIDVSRVNRVSLNKIYSYAGVLSLFQFSCLAGCFQGRLQSGIFPRQS